MVRSGWPLCPEARRDAVPRLDPIGAPCVGPGRLRPDKLAERPADPDAAFWQPRDRSCGHRLLEALRNAATCFGVKGPIPLLAPFARNLEVNHSSALLPEVPHPGWLAP